MDRDRGEAQRAERKQVHDAPVLGYSLREQRIRELTLLEDAEGFQLKFAMVPAWVGWVNVGISLGVGGLWLIGLSVILTLVYRISPGGPMFWRFAWHVVPTYFLGAVAWTAVGAYEFWWHRRWSHVPRVLGVRGCALYLSGPGFFGHMRVRNWAIADVTDVRITRMKSLTGRQAAALRIRFRKGMGLYRRMTTRDPQLIDRLERALRRAMDQAKRPVSG